LAKPYGSPVTNCPFCKKPIGDQHPYVWCVECGDHLPPETLRLIPKQVEEAKKVAADAESKVTETLELAAIEEKVRAIFISTGPIHQSFQVVDVVFAMDSQEQGFFAELLGKTVGFHVGANPSKAFDKVKLQLRYQCASLGGDAVVNCQFEHRVALTNSLIPGTGGKQTVEIFAYGTVVKLIKD